MEKARVAYRPRPNNKTGILPLLSSATLLMPSMPQSLSTVIENYEVLQAISFSPK